jgi:hypothetical protein
MYSGRQWLTILLSGGTTAFAFMMALSGSIGGMFLSNFTQLPLFLAGLSLGMTGTIAAAAVASGVLLIAGVSGGVPLLLILYAAPTIILTRQAVLSRPDGQGGQEWYPAGLLLLWATGIAMVLLTVGFILLSSGAESIEAGIRQLLDQVFQRMMPAGKAEQRQLLVDAIAPFLPGISAAMWILLVAVNGSLAQGLLVRGQRNMRPSPDLATLELPRTLLFVLAIAVAAGVLLPGSFGYVGRNIAVVLGVPYFFAGLGVLHFLSRRHPAGVLLLFLCYMILILLSLFFKWPTIAVAMVGVLDQWTDLRHRLRNRGPD